MEGFGKYNFFEKDKFFGENFTAKRKSEIFSKKTNFIKTYFIKTYFIKNKRKRRNNIKFRQFALIFSGKIFLKLTPIA